MFVHYDQGFNLNELFVLLVLILGILLVWKLPARFSVQEAAVFLLYSIFIGTLMDHSISIEPVDYYDVNDISKYEVMDFLTYVMYGPYGYLFIYIWDYYKLRLKYAPLYILCWALLSLAMELLAVNLGVYHYKNGYLYFFSFPFYLVVLTPLIGLYLLIRQESSMRN